MRAYRLIYGLIWIIAVLAYSLPWASSGEEVFTGWSFTIPFSVTYLIGLLLGLVVLITKRSAFWLSLAAGILMILGVAAAGAVGEFGGMLAELTGETWSWEPGVGFAFLWSVIFTIAGPAVGRRMNSDLGEAESSTQREQRS